MRPKYDYGDELRVTRNVRNDGTFPGKNTGELLLHRGAVGCVYDIGTFLQDQIVYQLRFIKEDKIVGCREEELIPASDPWFPNLYEFNDKVLTKQALAVSGEIIVQKGSVGKIMKVIREDHGKTVHYHVNFGDERMFQVPESSLEKEPLP